MKVPSDRSPCASEGPLSQLSPASREERAACAVPHSVTECLPCAGTGLGMGSPCFKEIGNRGPGPYRKGLGE